MQKKQPSLAKIVGIVLSFALLGGVALAILHWQDIYDWSRLRNYQPPANIAQLATDTTMNNYGRKLFYVNHPEELDDKATFSGKCNSTEQSIVLGCYSESKGIYIYNVPDARLNGVQEVTAAHEMLHAAYDRLSSSEKAKIDALTASTFAGLNDQRLKDTIEAYRSKDPRVVPNELHSILGTEVRNLPPELEQYYKKYFTDRGKVVAYSEAYEGEFTKRNNQIADYNSQLNRLNTEIEAAKKNLDSQYNTLTAQQQQMDNLLATKQYEAYNSQVYSYNAGLARYKALVNSTNAKIDQFNTILSAYNAIATEQRDLVKALDSRLQTQQAQ